MSKFFKDNVPYSNQVVCMYEKNFVDKDDLHIRKVIEFHVSKKNNL